MLVVENCFRGFCIGWESIAELIAVVLGKEDQSTYFEPCPDCA